MSLFFYVFYFSFSLVSDSLSMLLCSLHVRTLLHALIKVNQSVSHLHFAGSLTVSINIIFTSTFVVNERRPII